MKKVVARHGPEISREYSGLKVAQSRVDKLAHPHTVLQVSTRMLKKVDAAPPYATYIGLRNGAQRKIVKL